VINHIVFVSHPSPPITIEETCVNVSWTKRGITVTENNYSGVELHQIRNSTAILFDSNLNTLYVAGNGNARIVKWRSDDNEQGNRTDQLGWAYDKKMPILLLIKTS